MGQEAEEIFRTCRGGQEGTTVGEVTGRAPTVSLVAPRGSVWRKKARPDGTSTTYS